MSRILISNDDGIYGVGLNALIKAVRPLGEVIVVVPDSERSAASHSITLHKPFRVQRMPIELGAKDLIYVYVANGTPSDCVKFGIHQVLKGKKVELVIGGINNGPNLGEDTIYSGTVAVARQGAMLGVPAFAISVTKDSKPCFLMAAKVAFKIAKKVLKNKLPPRVFLNVNVPPSLNHNSSLKITSLGRRVYGKAIPSGIDPRGNPYYWLAGDVPKGIPEKGTDIEAIKSHFVSITPLTLDSTCNSFLPELKSWEF